MSVAIDDSVTVWSAAPSDRAGADLLVLLHGYGSNEGDLIGLAPSLPAGLVLASLRAPVTAQWPVDGHAWFPLDDPGSPRADAVDDAARAVLAWLDAVEAEGRFRSVGLLGFSQGGATALQLLRHAPSRFRYAVNLAGFVAQGAHDGDDELAELRPAVFWGRGSADEVISPAAILRTTDWLPGHSTLSGRIYEGLAHAVSAQELADVSAFVDKQLGA
ncbi:alpha/beta hydrolase [Mycetocola reblochoni]|uniref:Possible phospholipase/carboxylesterase n=2 Tax=Mycetocola reblochoni TaxID=331618 RepID=A0A1R4IDA4_9MICO|nr:alpha/beta hydrolase-fold protein [Mycetocola reblochoni]RLP69096.1 esterase [Mycetocola reblochoni]SJN17812.1 possible phospholipase/carboxylesterase [Mycetocola reblochoni REB411]